MLVIIEALLLISAALGQDHRTADAEGQIFPLDMAENSVDDLYVGCRKSITCLVEKILLPNELNISSEFRMVWQDAVKDHEPPADNLAEIHSIAIHVYTNSRFDLYQDFNNAVLTDKQKYKDRTYTWYSLQFLLIEAIQILKETQNGCKSTYRGANIEFDKNVLNTEVRFGQFASSSLELTEAKRYGNVSCFEIRTCEGADVSKYSTFPHEKEVLIPPYEKFHVTAVKTNRDETDLWCATVFVLESTGVRSDLNCALFTRPTESVTKAPRFSEYLFGRRRFGRYAFSSLQEDPMTLELLTCSYNFSIAV